MGNLRDSGEDTPRRTCDDGEFSAFAETMAQRDYRRMGLSGFTLGDFTSLDPPAVVKKVKFYCGSVGEAHRMLQGLGLAPPGSK